MGFNGVSVARRAGSAEAADMKNIPEGAFRSLPVCEWSMQGSTLGALTHAGWG